MDSKNPRKPTGDADTDSRRPDDPVGGRDRSHKPQADMAQYPGGGGAPGTGDRPGVSESDEARNQRAGSAKSPAPSGNPE